MDDDRNVLQFMLFKAPYGGNFIKSLLKLEVRLNIDGISMIYLFPAETAERTWAREMIAEGKILYFLTGNKVKDLMLIRKVIRKHKIRIIHTHFTGVSYHSLFTITRMLAGKKTVLIRHLHSYYPRNKFLVEILKKTASHVDLYIGCGKAVADYYRDLNHINEKKIIYIPNAIDFTRLEQFEYLDKKELRLNENTKILLMFGYNYFIKGVDIAIDAINELVAEHNDISLLISLSGNKELVTEKIRTRLKVMPDWVRILDSRNDVATYYRFSDAFLSPSRSEGFCYSMIEAAYCGIPTVASDCPAQVMLNVPYTYYFKSQDVADLKQKIISMLSLKEDEKARNAKIQKDYVSKTFDLNEWADRIFAIYSTFYSKSQLVG